MLGVHRGKRLVVEAIVAGGRLPRLGAVAGLVGEVFPAGFTVVFGGLGVMGGGSGGGLSVGGGSGGGLSVGGLDAFGCSWALNSLGCFVTLVEPLGSREERLTVGGLMSWEGIKLPPAMVCRPSANVTPVGPLGLCS